MRHALPCLSHYFVQVLHCCCSSKAAWKTFSSRFLYSLWIAYSDITHGCCLAWFVLAEQSLTRSAFAQGAPGKGDVVEHKEKDLLSLTRTHAPFCFLQHRLSTAVWSYRQGRNISPSGQWRCLDEDVSYDQTLKWPVICSVRTEMWMTSEVKQEHLDPQCRITKSS